MDVNLSSNFMQKDCFKIQNFTSLLNNYFKKWYKYHKQGLTYRYSIYQLLQYSSFYVIATTWTHPLTHFHRHLHSLRSSLRTDGFHAVFTFFYPIAVNQANSQTTYLSGYHGTRKINYLVIPLYIFIVKRRLSNIVEALEVMP